MYITLRCSSCGDVSIVSFDDLCAIWKRGYDTMSEENKQEAHVKTSVQCDCGNKDTYDSPTLEYAFQLIFDEVVRKKHV
jgi:hypothetical protein